MGKLPYQVFVADSQITVATPSKPLETKLRALAVPGTLEIPGKVNGDSQIFLWKSGGTITGCATVKNGTIETVDFVKDNIRRVGDPNSGRFQFYDVFVCDFKYAPKESKGSFSVEAQFNGLGHYRQIYSGTVSGGDPQTGTLSKSPFLLDTYSGSLRKMANTINDLYKECNRHERVYDLKLVSGQLKNGVLQECTVEEHSSNGNGGKVYTFDAAGKLLTVNHANAGARTVAQFRADSTPSVIRPKNNELPWWQTYFADCCGLGVKVKSCS